MSEEEDYYLEQAERAYQEECLSRLAKLAIEAEDHEPEPEFCCCQMPDDGGKSAHNHCYRCDLPMEKE